MVSASKMQKAQDRAMRSIPYAQGIYDVVNKMGDIKGYDSVYLKHSKKVKNVAILVIGTSRGFVGSQLTGLIIKTHNLAKEVKEKYGEAVVVKGISVHKTGQRILQNAGVENDYHFADYIEAPTTTELTPIFSLLVEKFDKGEYDEIHIVYTHFVNTLIQKAKSKQLLPLSIEDILKEAKETKDTKNKRAFVFEPNPGAVLDRLLPEYFQTQIFTGILESIASEHSARMVAMKSATDNANELRKKLTLEYNRTRQAGITQEIIEIVSGTLT